MASGNDVADEGGQQQEVDDGMSDVVASIKIKKRTNKEISTNINWIVATTGAMAATSMAATTTEATKGRATAFALCQGQAVAATTTADQIVR